MLKSFRQGHSLPTAKSLQQKRRLACLARFSGVGTRGHIHQRMRRLAVRTSLRLRKPRLAGRLCEVAGRLAEQNHLIPEVGSFSRFSLGEKEPEPARSEHAGQNLVVMGGGVGVWGSLLDRAELTSQSRFTLDVFFSSRWKKPLK